MIFRQILYVFVNFIYFLVVALQFLMFARAVMSWIMTDDENAVSRFVNAMTDPIILPIRALLDKIEPLRGLPIDLSFFAAFLLLMIIQNILPTVAY